MHNRVIVHAMSFERLGSRSAKHVPKHHDLSLSVLLTHYRDGPFAPVVFHECQSTMMLTYR